MKVAIFGATGNSGLKLVEQALQRGHQVSAIVRNPTRLSEFESNPNFKIVKANILNADELAKELTGQDCVLSALGVAGIAILKITFYLDSMKAIVEAMRKAQCDSIHSNRKLILADQNYPKIYTFVLRPMIGRQLNSMNEMEDFLFTNCQDIDFTIVRPPGLTDAPLEDGTKEVVNENAYFFPDSSTRSRIPRANVARFMLDEMDKNLYIKKGVAIDLPKVVA